jgi:hypothetical protein
MEMLLSRDLRIVFEGPVRVLDTALGAEVRLNHQRILKAAGLLEEAKRIIIKPRTEKGTFDLVGTAESPFPLGLIGVLEFPAAPLQDALQAHAGAFLGGPSPFASWTVSSTVLRIFDNGYASVALTMDFVSVPCADDASDQVELRRR